MWEYWLVFLVPVALAIGNVRVTPFGWALVGGIFSAFIGLRYGVGTDWVNYLRSYYYPAATQSFIDVIVSGDPAYRMANWVAAQLGLRVWAVNLVAAVIFVVGLLRFIKRLPEPLLALVAAVPYVVIVVGMNYNRQAAALGVILWSLNYLFDGKLGKYAAGILIAGMFHKSAVIFLPAMALAGDRVRLRTAVLAIGTAGLGFVLLLAEQADALWEQYVVSDYSQASEGGPVRVLMNAAPACVFILARGRIWMSAAEKRFWLWVSIVSLVCVPLVFLAPTGVDRVALYFTPLQFVMAAHFPLLFGRESRVAARVAVISAYACVLFVWLNYASNAGYWLPYEFWPYWE